MQPISRFVVFILFIASLFPENLYSEYSLEGYIGKRGGEYLFETGNRFPNLSGIRGGSRISFERDYNFVGLGGKWMKDQWEVSGKFSTTGWAINNGEARDEDFFMNNTSQERAHHIATRELSYHDSTTVYSGTRNFADGIGKSRMNEYGFDIFTRYYLEESKADILQSGDGFFLSTGVKYTYNKYIFYDVTQWIATNPIFYQPIGLGLSFSSTILEIPFGIGYRWNWEKFYLDTSIHFLFAYIQTRDFHIQRNINFLSKTGGTGIIATADLGYKFSNRFFGFLRMNQHRFFTKGNFEADGGLSEEDILANFVGKYKAHINTKEYSLELGVELRPEWGNRNIQRTEPSKVEGIY